MEFNYFTDEIILNDSDRSNFSYLDFFIENVKKSLMEIGINNQEVNFFYKRRNNRSSVLGIQLNDGDMHDLSNYLIFDCSSFVYDKNIICSIDMHALSNISQKAVQFVNLENENIRKFFDLVEHNMVGHEKYDIFKTVFLEKKKNIFIRLLNK